MYIYIHTVYVNIITPQVEECAPPVCLLVYSTHEVTRDAVRLDTAGVQGMIVGMMGFMAENDMEMVIEATTMGGMMGISFGKLT